MVKKYINKNWVSEENKKATLDKEKILQLIEIAKLEMNIARENFNYLDEPKLIEMSIYQEQAAKSKFEYLISEARKKGIKVEKTQVYLSSCK